MVGAGFQVREAAKQSRGLLCRGGQSPDPELESITRMRVIAHPGPEALGSLPCFISSPGDRISD